MAQNNDQIAKMKHLMNFGKFETTAADKGALEYHATGGDGKVYGIVRENTKYYIKTTAPGDEMLVESYDYIGGFCNRRNHEYNSYNKALKQFELKMMSINEACGVKNNVTTLDPYKKEYLVLEETEKMRAEIARQREIMYNAGRILGESAATIGFTYTGVPEAPKTAEGEPKSQGTPFIDKAEAKLDKDLKAAASNPEKQGDPFEENGEATDADMQNDKNLSGSKCDMEKPKYAPKNAVAAMKPSGGKVVKVNENCGGKTVEESCAEEIEEEVKYNGKQKYDDGSTTHSFETNKNHYQIHRNKHGIPSLNKYKKTNQTTQNEQIEECDEWGSAGLPTSPGVGDGTEVEWVKDSEVIKEDSMDAENFVGMADEPNKYDDIDLETLMNQYYDEPTGRAEWDEDSYYDENGDSSDQRMIHREIDLENDYDEIDDFDRYQGLGDTGESWQDYRQRMKDERADRSAAIRSKFGKNGIGEGKIIVDKLAESIVKVIKEAMEGEATAVPEKKQYEKWLDQTWFRDSGYSPFRKHYDAILTLYNELRKEKSPEMVDQKFTELETKANKLIKVVDGIKNGKKLALKPQEEASYKAIIQHNPQAADQLVQSVKRAIELGSHYWDEKYAVKADQEFTAKESEYAASKPEKTYNYVDGEKGSGIGVNNTKIPGVGKKVSKEMDPSDAQIKKAGRGLGLPENIVREVADKIIETVLHDFGSHPGYRKKVMTLPKTNDSIPDGYRDIDDESAKGEEPFGKEIGSSAPFDQKVKMLTDRVMKDISEVLKKN